MTSFSDFGLAEPITRALAEEGYSTPTPIQARTIPVTIAGRDLIGIAQTGTGKTAAFALPILHRLAHAPRPLTPKSPRVLVLSPTRELSDQILQSFRAYGRHLPLHSTLAIGGVPIGRQVRALAGGVDVLVATPGRLLDLMQSNAVRIDRIEVLVLDEADRMLDMGFIHDIRKIIAKLPRQRQTLLFSATMPAQIVALAADLLQNPERIAVTPVAATADRVTQRAIHVDRGGKATLLADLLRREPIERALVFTRTKHGADKVVRGLAKGGVAAEAIHGNKSQNQRERVLSAFRDGRVRVLIATDIAARGIDVDGVSHVINFDLPHEPETYVHRIGRTARAGAEGVAISFCSADETPLLRGIERLIRMSVPVTGDDRPAARAPQAERTQAPRSRPERSDGRRAPRPAARDASRGTLASTEGHSNDIARVGFMRQPPRSGNRKAGAPAMRAGN